MKFRPGLPAGISEQLTHFDMFVDSYTDAAGNPARPIVIGQEQDGCLLGLENHRPSPVVPEGVEGGLPVVMGMLVVRDGKGQPVLMQNDVIVGAHVIANPPVSPDKKSFMDRLRRRETPLAAAAEPMARLAILGQAFEQPSDTPTNETPQQSLEDFYGLKPGVTLSEGLPPTRWG